jgi:ABC-type nitrate/sulfonate/bicarbonate transport system substrate-binding protein
LNGIGITISNELFRRGLANPSALHNEIVASRNRRTYTFGIASAFSAHHFLLRQWLQSGHINPEQDVRLVVVPPPQMVLHLKSGHLDGFCVGEPWNTVANTARIGRWVTDSTRLAHGHPNKVLLVRRDFAEEHNAEHEALIAALLMACAYCDVAEHHEQICHWLARPEFLDTPLSALRPGLSGRFHFSGGAPVMVEDFHIFHRQEANEPTQVRAAWAVNHLRASGAIAEAKLNVPQLIREIFRADIYQSASRLVKNDAPMSNEAICA